MINSVDKTKLSCNTPHHRSTTVSLETYPLTPEVLLSLGRLAKLIMIALSERPASRVSLGISSGGFVFLKGNVF